MVHDPALQTSASLLALLRQGETDQAAWAEFVHRYGPLVYRWCRRWHLPASDAEEVTQAVLVKLAEKMRAFTYDPSRGFRAYLKTVARYTWYDFLRACQRPDRASGDPDVSRALQAVEAGDDLAQRLEAQFDRELLAEAQARVRERVEPRTWDAFRLTAVEGLSGADAAGRLGVKVATVFQAKCRVQHLLQDEVARLEGA
jgi:RNA polymerase sigma factor (sigma-70 family)